MPRRASCMAAATSRTVIPLGFSLETLLFMKPNASCPDVSRSVGSTRVPARPTTIWSPCRTSIIGMQSAAQLRPDRPRCRSPSPASATRIQFPLRRICVS